MNDLRLILILLGVGLISGIYIWEFFQQRSMRRRHTVVQEEPSFELPRRRQVPDGTVIQEFDAAPAQSGERISVNGDPQRGAALQPREHTASAAALSYSAINEAPGLFHTEGAPTDEVAAEGIIVLYVAAVPGRSFAGRAILDGMRAADLRYGHMKVFHRYSAQSGPSPEPLFSVADMYEPGNFDLDTMDEFSTRGLSLFMHAPTSVDAKSVFEDMLGAAELLARILDGEVLDEDRKTLDAARTAGIRARLGH